MLFNSLTFLIFIALFAGFYFTTHGRSRLWVICIASYVFYGWWDWRFMGLLFSMTLICWYCALRLDATRDMRHRQYWMVAAITVCLIILGFFKYVNFFEDNARALLLLFGFQASWPTLHVLMPIGISFFMFQGLSYVVDVARGDLPVEKSLLKVVTFIAFFPQLVAGPIIRAADFMPQLEDDRRPTSHDFMVGICLIMWGYVMKVGMADSLSSTVEARFHSPRSFSAEDLLIGLLFYAFQIYGDFGGYSLIAVGVARVFGFHFKLNFRCPYFATSITDFWRRWHISLSQWLRDYLYIPLGGNRCSKLKVYRNLMVTMLLGGLWHGAAWTFVAWGGLHGTYLSTEKFLINESGGMRPKHVAARVGVRVAQSIGVFILVCVSWTFFRAQSFSDAWVILTRVIHAHDFTTRNITGEFQVFKGFVLIAVVIVGDLVWSNVHLDEMLRRYWWLGGSFCGLSLIFLLFFGTFQGNSFIYFQF